MMQEDRKLFAFVLMPFSRDFDDVYELGIKETVAALGIVAERVDEQLFHEGILDRIYRQIEAADLIVADMSGQNVNVFYEVGYAHAKRKLCILMTRDASDIPFDLKDRRHIEYGGSITRLKERLREEFSWARDEVAKFRSCGLDVQLKSTRGDLERSQWTATGVVDFQIDLFKRTNETSTELSAIYFYTGKGWTLKQFGDQCGRTESDIPEFHLKHALASSVTHFRKDTWTQVRFTASKVLAYITKGQEATDVYHCRGIALVRLVTSEGTFDYPFTLDVEVDEMPF